MVSLEEQDAITQSISFLKTVRKHSFSLQHFVCLFPASSFFLILSFPHSLSLSQLETTYTADRERESLTVKESN